MVLTVRLNAAPIKLKSIIYRFPNKNPDSTTLNRLIIIADFTFIANKTHRITIFASPIFIPGTGNGIGINDSR